MTPRVGAQYPLQNNIVSLKIKVTENPLGNSLYKVEAYNARTQQFSHVLTEGQTSTSWITLWSGSILNLVTFLSDYQILLSPYSGGDPSGVYDPGFLFPADIGGMSQLCADVISCYISQTTTGYLTSQRDLVKKNPNVTPSDHYMRAQFDISMSASTETFDVVPLTLYRKCYYWNLQSGMDSGYVPYHLSYYSSTYSLGDVKPVVIGPQLFSQSVHQSHTNFRTLQYSTKVEYRKSGASTVTTASVVGTVAMRTALFNAMVSGQASVGTYYTIADSSQNTLYAGTFGIFAGITIPPPNPVISASTYPYYQIKVQVNGIPSNLLPYYRLTVWNKTAGYFYVKNAQASGDTSGNIPFCSDGTADSGQINFLSPPQNVLYCLYQVDEYGFTTNVTQIPAIMDSSLSQLASQALSQPDVYVSSTMNVYTTNFFPSSTPVTIKRSVVWLTGSTPEPPEPPPPVPEPPIPPVPNPVVENDEFDDIVIRQERAVERAKRILTPMQDESGTFSFYNSQLSKQDLNQPLIQAGISYLPSTYPQQTLNQMAQFSKEIKEFSQTKEGKEFYDKHMKPQPNQEKTFFITDFYDRVSKLPPQILQKYPSFQNPSAIVSAFQIDPMAARNFNMMWNEKYTPWLQEKTRERLFSPSWQYPEYIQKHINDSKQHYYIQSRPSWFEGSSEYWNKYGLPYNPFNTTGELYTMKSNELPSYWLDTPHPMFIQDLIDKGTNDMPSIKTALSNLDKDFNSYIVQKDSTYQQIANQLVNSAFSSIPVAAAHYFRGIVGSSSLFGIIQAYQQVTGESLVPEGQDIVRWIGTAAGTAAIVKTIRWMQSGSADALKVAQKALSISLLVATTAFKFIASNWGFLKDAFSQYQTSENLKKLLSSFGYQPDNISMYILNQFIKKKKGYVMTQQDLKEAIGVTDSLFEVIIGRDMGSVKNKALDFAETDAAGKALSIYSLLETYRKQGMAPAAAVLMLAGFASASDEMQERALKLGLPAFERTLGIKINPGDIVGLKKQASKAVDLLSQAGPVLTGAALKQAVTMSLAPEPREQFMRFVNDQEYATFPIIIKETVTNQIKSSLYQQLKEALENQVQQAQEEAEVFYPEYETPVYKYMRRGDLKISLNVKSPTLNEPPPDDNIYIDQEPNEQFDIGKFKEFKYLKNGISKLGNATVYYTPLVLSALYDGAGLLGSYGLSGLQTAGSYGLSGLQTAGSYGLSGLQTAGSYGLSGLETAGSYGLSGLETAGSYGLSGLQTAGSYGLSGLQTAGSYGLSGLQTVGSLGINAMQYAPSIAQNLHFYALSSIPNVLFAVSAANKKINTIFKSLRQSDEDDLKQIYKQIEDDRNLQSSFDQGYENRLKFQKSIEEARFRNTTQSQSQQRSYFLGNSSDLNNTSSLLNQTASQNPRVIVLNSTAPQNSTAYKNATSDLNFKDFLKYSAGIAGTAYAAKKVYDYSTSKNETKVVNQDNLPPENVVFDPKRVNSTQKSTIWTLTQQLFGINSPEDAMVIDRPQDTITVDGRARSVHAYHQYIHFLPKVVAFENRNTQRIVLAALSQHFSAMIQGQSQLNNKKGVVLFKILKSIVDPQDDMEYQLNEIFMSYIKHGIFIDPIKAITQESDLNSLHSVIRLPHLITDFIEKVVSGQETDFVQSQLGSFYIKTRPHRQQYDLIQPMKLREKKDHVYKVRDLKAVYKEKLPQKLTYINSRDLSELQQNRQFELKRRRLN